MAEATFTFRVDEELKAAFTTAAKASDRNAAQLLRDYMRERVKQYKQEADYGTWFRQQVREGIADADAGNLMPADEAEAEFAAMRAEAHRKLKDEAA